MLSISINSTWSLKQPSLKSSAKLTCFTFPMETEPHQYCTNLTNAICFHAHYLHCYLFQLLILLLFFLPLPLLPSISFQDPLCTTLPSTPHSSYYLPFHSHSIYNSSLHSPLTFLPFHFTPTPFTTVPSSPQFYIIHAVIGTFEEEEVDGQWQLSLPSLF